MHSTSKHQKCNKWYWMGWAYCLFSAGMQNADQLFFLKRSSCNDRNTTNERSFAPGCRGGEHHRRKLSGGLGCALVRENNGGELHFWYRRYCEALCNVSVTKHTNTLTVLAAVWFKKRKGSKFIINILSCSNSFRNKRDLWCVWSWGGRGSVCAYVAVCCWIFCTQSWGSQLRPSSFK